MENKPLISVLLPVYNCELYIQEAVDSILNQTYANFELIIIDDCSTDATVSILKTYNDSRINLIIKPENTGYTNSLNYGISIAKGDYIARMDGDDISLPERFEKQVGFLENNEDYILCGSLYSIIGSGKIISVPENHEDIKHTMLEYSPFGHPTVMMRKSTLNKLPFIYNVEKEPAEDYDLWVRLLLIGKLHNLQDALLQYRIHDSQVSSSRTEKQKLLSVDIKFDLLKNINYVFSDNEEKVYKKVISYHQKLDFKEIQIFNNLKYKLIKSNTNGFFNQEKIIVFFNNFEKRLVNQYFISRKNFSPQIFFQYLKINRKLSYKIPKKDELKMVIKSLIFYKSK